MGLKPFDPPPARFTGGGGARFILVGADVALLARGSEQLAQTFIPSTDGSPGASY
ncbi:hypothetical protein [Nocardia farcinica]|uniref:hypothetical protein n=1 Tax=Nocardia farcinica TaxID=37329 RepID=UPI002454F9CF|nr:hypothetical protein [Nocardia farcinica]